MKAILKWTGISIGIGVAGFLGYEAVQSVRTKLKGALRRAEAVTQKTEAAVAETRSALQAAEQAV
jgi:hypothetical protein